MATTFGFAGQCQGWRKGRTGREKKNREGGEAESFVIREEGGRKRERDERETFYDN